MNRNPENESFPPISKRCIFITSGGRTATYFLKEIISNAIQDCHSVQEPDLLHLRDPFFGPKGEDNWVNKIRTFGLFNMTFGKFMNNGNVRNLSLGRQQGELDENAAAFHLYNLRQHYLRKIKESIYAESNLQLAGLIDVIPKVFPNSKTVFIVRDGRSWVRSYLNWDYSIFGKKDVLAYLSSGRANSEMFPHDPYFHRWKTFSQFQKICWLWRFHVDYALKTMDKNPLAKVVRYEDIFNPKEEVESINRLLEYLTAFPDGFKAKYNYGGELTGKKFHDSKRSGFPDWKNWSLENVAAFLEICGELSDRFGYGQEPQWQEMAARARKS